MVVVFTVGLSGLANSLRVSDFSIFRFFFQASQSFQKGCSSLSREGIHLVCSVMGAKKGKKAGGLT